MDKNLKDLWVGWTRDAMARYESPDEIKYLDELIDDMADTATGYADAMLEEYEERFSGGAGRKRRAGGKKKRARDDDDDDDDLED